MAKIGRPKEDVEVRRWRLFKNKYILAFYDENDMIVAVFNNTFDLSLSTGIDEFIAQQIISKVYNNKSKSIMLHGKRCKVHFIEDK